MFGQGRISALFGRKSVSKPTVAVDTTAVDTVFADVSVIDVESCFVDDQLPNRRRNLEDCDCELEIERWDRKS
jgi:hypothetical protein